jgi:ATP-dependent phosphofructokinase / diphosphate-dependent phosphofructokinase
MFKGNAIVGQSGGPTSVINASLAGVVETAVRSKTIDRIFGMRFGIEGVLNDFLLDLGSESPATLKGLRTTPSSALGSSRLKLKDEHFEPILRQLKRYNIRYFFMIGGNDTMDTIHRVVEYARQHGYEMHGVGVCKTVDNDLFGVDHTPGFPSAARYVALSVLQGGLLARDMQRVDQFTIFQTVGRSAGWLPAAAACAKQSPADPPHLILMPERPFDREAFLDAVAEGAATVRVRFDRVRRGDHECGRHSGQRVPDQRRLSQRRIRRHGRHQRGDDPAPDHQRPVRLAGRVPSDRIAADVRRRSSGETGYRRSVRLRTRGRASWRERGVDGVMVTIERVSKPGEAYRSRFGTISLRDVANAPGRCRTSIIRRDGMFVTKAFLDYARPLVGELPAYADLTIKRAKP